MSFWFVVWLLTLALAWLVIDEVGWWWRLTDDNLQHTKACWRATIDDLEATQADLAAAQRRIRDLELQRDVEGEAWKL